MSIQVVRFKIYTSALECLSIYEKDIAIHIEKQTLWSTYVFTVCHNEIVTEFSTQTRSLYIS